MIGIERGWQCPVCERVYSPVKMECPYCNKRIELAEKATDGILNAQAPIDTKITNMRR